MDFFQAIEQGASLSAVKQILEGSPTAVREQRTLANGRTLIPLHMAIQQGASFEIIHFLIETWPEGVKFEDEAGCVALHSAVSRWVQSPNPDLGRIISLLLQTWPLAIEKEMQGSPILTPFGIAYMQKFCENGPEKSSYLYASNSHGRPLYLHLACWLGLPEPAICVIVERFPEAVGESDPGGNLPIHVACSAESPIQVVRLLIERYTGNLAVRNSGGHSPLRLCYDEGFTPRVEVIDLLVDRCPELCQLRDNDTNRVPLQEAVFCGYPVEIIRALRNGWPEGIQDRIESSGDTVLHHALAGNAGDEVIAFLLDSWPRAAAELNKRNQYPLHLACAKIHSLETITSLTKAYPKALMQPDSLFCTPLDVATAVYEDAHVDVVAVLRELSNGKRP